MPQGPDEGDDHGAGDIHRPRAVRVGQRPWTITDWNGSAFPCNSAGYC